MLLPTRDEVDQKAMKAVGTNENSLLPEGYFTVARMVDSDSDVCNERQVNPSDMIHSIPEKS